MKRFILISTIGLVLLFVYLFVWNTEDSNTTEATSLQVNNAELAPMPQLSPREVVDMQLKAMQENNEPYKDHGIEVAYRFASPSNKEATGPLHHFVNMVHNERYRSLLNFQRYGLDDAEVLGDKALQKATLIDAEGEPVVYVFQLARQQEGEFYGCWMTEGVIRL